MGFVFLFVLLLLPLSLSVHAEDLGKLSANLFHGDSTRRGRRRTMPE